MADIQRRQQIWKDLGGNLTEKAAELANTYDMPSQNAPSKTKVEGKDKAVIKTSSSFKELAMSKEKRRQGVSAVKKKVHGAAAGAYSRAAERMKVSSAPMTQEQVEELILKQAFGNGVGTPAAADSGGATSTNENDALAEQPADVPQGKALKPRVDVSGKEPPKVVVTKTAQRYALPSLQRYPLDSYGEVEKAASYFEHWHKRMNPEMRREFCQNMVKRASALSIPTSDLAQRYASDHWAPREQIKIALDARRTVTLNEDHLVLLDKLAGQQKLMHPDDFAATLGEFDKLAGLNHHYDVDVPDPYFSCFAKHAKHPQDVDPDETIIIGNEVLTTRKLVEMSHESQTILKERFGDDFTKEFSEDPKALFDSLPRDQKLVLMRMASSVGNPRTGASVG